MRYRQALQEDWVRSGLWLMLGVVMTLMVELLLPLSRGTDAGFSSTSRISFFRPAGRPRAGSAGPWGQLEYYPLMLQPDDFYTDVAQAQPAKWFFENYTAPELEELFSSCDLTTGQRAFFLDTNRWVTLTNGYAIAPPDKLVLSLSKRACQRLYPILADSEQNLEQQYPFRFHLDGFYRQFKDSGLAPASLKVIYNQTYTNAGWLCFSMMHPLHRTMDPAEFRLLKRALYKIPALRVRLRVTPKSDIDGLVRYWGRGGRERMIRPMLESLAKNPAGDSIGIPYFFPPFARLSLNTYPDPYTDPEAAKEDCFYTALNFFNAQPDPRFRDHSRTRDALLARYDFVHDQPVFGDLVLLLNSDQAALHICVYVADDIVFTKDGVGYLQPWVLMKLSDVMADYPSKKPLHMELLRRKDLAAGWNPGPRE